MGGGLITGIFSKDLIKSMGDSSKAYLNIAKHLHSTMPSQSDDIICYLCYLSAIQLVKEYVLLEFDSVEETEDDANDADDKGSFKVITSDSSMVVNIVDFINSLNQFGRLVELVEIFDKSEMFPEILKNCEILQKYDKLFANKILSSDDNPELPDVNLALSSCEKLHSLIQCKG